MRVNLSHVSEQTGLSVSTVSKALQGSPLVAVKTRERVEQAAEKLRYRRNALASGLVSGRTNTIGVGMYDLCYLAAPYFGAIVSGIAEVTHRQGLGLMFASSKSVDSSEAECVRIVREGRLDAMIIIDQVVPELESETLLGMGLELVLVDQPLSDKGFPVVRTDYSSAAHQAISYLSQMGHKHIVLMVDNSNIYSAANIVAGYRQAIEEQGLRELIPGQHGLGEAWTASRSKITQVLDELENGPDSPTAFLCVGDWIMLVLPEILRMRGLRIPEDASVVGVSSAETRLAEMLPVGIIRVPAYEMGLQACKLLLEKMEGKTATQEVVLTAAFKPGGLTQCGEKASKPSDNLKTKLFGRK